MTDARTLSVTILKDGAAFLHGTFDVPGDEYGLVAALLKDISMNHGQAASLLSGYMHAREVGTVTDDMGKLAMIATVHMLEAGETAIEIPLTTADGTPVS